MLWTIGLSVAAVAVLSRIPQTRQVVMPDDETSFLNAVTFGLLE